MVEIKGYRVRSSDVGRYVQVTWADEDRTEISNAWSDSIPGPLLTQAEAYRLAAHWLECGYRAKVVRVVARKKCTFCPEGWCICYAR